MPGELIDEGGDAARACIRVHQLAEPEVEGEAILRGQHVVHRLRLRNGGDRRKIEELMGESDS
jgi:hypothetical protein